MKEIDILIRSIKDFFSSYMLKIAFVPLFLTMLILYILFFGAATYGLESLQSLSEAYASGAKPIVDENAPFYYHWFAYLLQYSFVSWIVGFLLYTLGSIFIFHISLVFTLVIIGFLTPLIVSKLHKTYYSKLEIKPFGTLTNATTNALKAFFVMILLYILFVPLYFIPLLNLIAFYIPLYYFFHKMLNFDVASTVLNKEEYELIYKQNSGYFRIKTFILYLLSTVPFISLFLAVFFVIYLSHSYFIKLEELKNEF